MKLIIKQPIDKKEWATVFCVGDHACEIGGNLSNTALEKMRAQGIIQVLDPVQLIDKHPKHTQLIAESESNHYLGIGPDEKYPALQTIYKTELFCDRCNKIIIPIHEHIFEKDWDKGTVKFTSYMCCPECHRRLYSVHRTDENEKAAEVRQEELKKLGETWSKLY